MSNASATVRATFRSPLEQWRFTEEKVDVLIDQGIGMCDKLYLTTTILHKLACKKVRYIEHTVGITAMVEYKLYAFHICD